MDHLLKKERIQKFKETRDSRYICQNELDKGSFQHDMVYGDFKDLPRRTAPAKYYVIKHLILLSNIAFNIGFNIAIEKPKVHSSYRQNLGC